MCCEESVGKKKQSSVVLSFEIMFHILQTFFEYFPVKQRVSEVLPFSLCCSNRPVVSAGRKSKIEKATKQRINPLTVFVY